MKKGIGEKVLGWFIVEEDDSPKPSAPNDEVEDDSHDERATKAAPAVRANTKPSTSTEATAPIVVPGHAHDAKAFASVYRAAGLPVEDHERLAKVLDLLMSLPTEATPEVKRHIVGAALHAFGVPIDRIVATADAATAALDAYVVQGRRRTDEVLAQAQARIAKLSAEIEEVRGLMATQVAAQEELARSVGIEKARVHAALDFFGPNVRGVAPAQPRLVRLK